MAYFARKEKLIEIIIRTNYDMRIIIVENGFNSKIFHNKKAFLRISLIIKPQAVIFTYVTRYIQKQLLIIDVTIAIYKMIICFDFPSSVTDYDMGQKRAYKAPGVKMKKSRIAALFHFNNKYINQSPHLSESIFVG